MKILQLLQTLLANKERIKAISNTVIRVLDALDGVNDWEKKK